MEGICPAQRTETRPRGRCWSGSAPGGHSNIPLLLDSSWTNTTANHSRIRQTPQEDDLEDDKKRVSSETNCMFQRVQIRQIISGIWDIQSGITWTPSPVLSHSRVSDASGEGRSHVSKSSDNKEPSEHRLFLFSNNTLASRGCSTATLKKNEKDARW